MNEHLYQRGADTAVVGSAVLAGSAWIADVEPYVTFIAGIVAVIAGVCAAWYHLERAIEIRRKRYESESDRCNK